MLVAFDDDTLAAVLDDARIRSLDGSSEFVLGTPKTSRWGDERHAEGAYLSTLADRIAALRTEGVTVDHAWLPGEELIDEIADLGRERAVEGVVIAHHNPNDAIPDPEAFDDAIRERLGVPLDVISLE